MPKSNKSQIFTFRAGRWSPAFFLLGLLLACGGGGGGDQLNLNGLGCDSMPSAPKTEACAGGQLGTHTFQTETARCSANNGKIIVDDTKACLANTPSNRIALALKEGDSSLLSGSDADTLIDQVSTNYQSIVNAQNKVIAAFYQGLSAKFDLVRDSYMVQPSIPTMEKVFPLVVGDNGNVLASISTISEGRIAGYGYDILAGYIPSQIRLVAWNGTSEVPNRQTDHQPVFKRVLAWLVRGDVSSDLSTQSASKLNIAWSSLPTSNTVMYTVNGTQKVYKPYAADGLTGLNVPFTSMSCDPLSAPVADCAAKAQLVVMGAYDSRLRSDSVKTQTQLDRIKEIVAAKIPVLYLNAHPEGGAANDFARATFPEDFPRLGALGFANGDTPDRRNLYLRDYVSRDLTLTELTARNDPLKGALLSRIKSGPFQDATTYNWSNCVVDKNCVLPQGFTDDIVTYLSKISTLINDINKKGQNIFDPLVGNQTLQKLILWADAYRKTIVYPINKLTDPERFQKAYIADALIAYVRKFGSAQTDLGNFVGPEINTVKGSAVMENVTVTLPGSSGFTAVGRFVLPGQAVTLQLQNAPSAGTFTFFVNTAGSGNTKLFTAPVDSNGAPLVDTGYRRPRLPRSPDFTLSTQPITIVSPYGGLLQLRFNGATDHAVVLQIQGAARQPFYDTTQGTPSAAAFLNDFQTSKLGWLEIKTAGIEIHSVISKTMEFLLPDPAQPSGTVYPNVAKPYFDSASKAIDMNKYLAEAKKYVMEDGYQLAGFQAGGLQLNPHVASFCSSNGWDCVNPSIHKLPTLQHFHQDHAANCGWQCSGNPITSGGGFEPRGWGESHELGHNMQRFNIYDDRSGEVSNNIFPLHKKWRMRIDLGRDAIGYGNELPDSQWVFNMLKQTYLDNSKRPAEKLAKVRTDLWGDSATAAQNRLRLYFYLQWPLIYADILKAQNTLSEVDAIEAGWDIYTLLYLNQRQVEAASAADWPTVKANLGFSTYSSKPSTNSAADPLGYFPYHDYLLVALSLITGKDQTAVFDFWGVQTSQAGRDQVAALKDAIGSPLTAQPVKFYATRCSDDFRGYTSVDMAQANPAFPWPNEFKLDNNDSQAAGKQRAHDTYCKSARN